MKANHFIDARPNNLADYDASCVTYEFKSGPNMQPWRRQVAEIAPLYIQYAG